MKLAFFALVLLSSCGYHLSGPKDQPTVTVPYIEGDPEGELTSTLISELSKNGGFEVVRSGGNYQLDVVIINNANDRIGFRYDQHDTTRKLKKNLIGTENRRTIGAEITLIDPSGEAVIGPLQIQASAEYDYVDSSALNDLSFIQNGKRKTVINFSLGQLDALPGAEDDVATPLYKNLAQKIVDAIIKNYEPR